MKRYENKNQMMEDISFLQSELSDYNSKVSIVQDTCLYKGVSGEFAYWVTRAILDRDLEHALKQVRCAEATKEHKDLEVADKVRITIDYLTEKLETKEFPKDKAGEQK